MGDFDVMIDMSQILPQFQGRSLEWETVRQQWKSIEETPILLDSVSLTLKAIKIEMGSLSPNFKVIAEQFTHPVELIIQPTSDVLFEKTCALESTLPFIKADEMAAMSDVDGGRFEMTTSRLGKWADKEHIDSEYNDAGIPFSPFVIGYAKKVNVHLKEITVTVEEVEENSIKSMKRFLTARWTLSMNIRPIFGDQNSILSNPIKKTSPYLSDWIDRVEEAVRLCACEISMYAWSSVAGAAVPIPGTSIFVDIAICARMSNRFKTIFQEIIDMERITGDLKERFEYIPEEILLSNLKFLSLYIIQREAELIGESYLHKLVLSHVGNHTLKTASHWLPFVGAVVATSMAYPFMRHTAFHLIEEYEKTYVDGFKELHGKLMAITNS